MEDNVNSFYIIGGGKLFERGGGKRRRGKRERRRGYMNDVKPGTTPNLFEPQAVLLASLL